MIKDDHSLMGGSDDSSHGGSELVVDRLVSCCSLLFACSVISLIIGPQNVDYCTLHSI